ncbi:hypothetical protein B0H16DRAFT_1883066 [Mycena metata]|uniref:F-box domain-containing protein n=1 Tax=Mycena metata TaxID=1033252 RepID=A0AAD7JJ55_9AGAR|nr:hypothetical protein B0H16DRAFT_1883066 [Mycena metata]
MNFNIFGHLHQPSYVHLDQFNADVLLHIFSLTDVYTIGSLSQVNKHFHAVASTKQLWISVIRDLSHRRLIDAPPDPILETLSTEALKDEIRRVVNGPNTWSAQSMSLPTISRQITIALPETHRYSAAELLPGGTHIVLFFMSSQTRGLECREVHTGRKVWSREAPNSHVRSAAFDLHGESKMVACLVNDEAGEYGIVVLEVNLRTGESRDHLDLPLHAEVPSEMQISGDFICFRVAQTHGNPKSCVCVINWRADHFIVLELMSEKPPFAIFADHIMVSCPAPDSAPGSQHQLQVFPLSTFDSTPLSELNSRPLILFRVVPSTVLAASEQHNHNSPPIYFSISVASGPLREGRFEVTTVVIAPRPETPKGTSLIARLARRYNSIPTPYGSALLKTTFRYNLLLAPPHHLFFDLKSVSHDTTLALVETSRAGYSLWFVDGRVFVSRMEGGVRRGLEFSITPSEELDADFVNLARSGAVLAVFRSPPRAVVLYYR